MTVGNLIETMTYEELLGWYDYFERRPVGWREDDRSAKIIQAQGVKSKAWELFPTLKAIYYPSDHGKPEGVRGLQGSFLFHNMLNAKGGDKLEL
jgi:hypothetical protein